MSQRSGAIVRRAAEVIEKHGWVQGTAGDTEYGMCIRGAINFVEVQELDSPISTGSEYEFSEWMDGIGQFVELRAAHTLIARAGGRYLIPLWNDERGRTKEEVLLYMNKFADEVDPQGP